MARRYRLEAGPSEAGGLLVNGAKSVSPRLRRLLDLPGSCFVEIEDYRNGSLIRYPSAGAPPQSERAESRATKEQSVRSRLQAAWSLGNAEMDWAVMATLTYREAPSSYAEADKHRRRMRDAIRRKWPSVQWAWILEFQSRGAAHFHFFLSAPPGFAEEDRETVTRKGRKTELLRGEIERFIVSRWIDAVGDAHRDFLSFQWGGIVEALRSPDAAGRYAAKEAAKRVQKAAPWPVKRWWGMSRQGTPRLRRTRRMTVEEFAKANPEMGMVARTWSHPKS